MFSYHFTPITYIYIHQRDFKEKEFFDPFLPSIYCTVKNINVNLHRNEWQLCYFYKLTSLTYYLPPKVVKEYTTSKLV